MVTSCKTRDVKLRRLLRKVTEWARRYGMAEVLGTLAALAGAAAMFSVTRNEVAAAYAGAMAENVGFYLTLVLRELRRRRRNHDGVEESTWAPLKRLLWEFGPAELLDSGFIRPLAMGLAAHVVDRNLGIFIGKVIGDIFFYIPVIITYEFQQWRLRQRDIVIEP